ncbi:hypothetical protein PNOK_0815400 [Pyrrhoderma noxium]|uniref:Uncharacterized protein n=1 Tax=Pyrrhoderma noxium TaxID=2282107 RepID=A0A286UAI3_9AGAM|nr:hypothetical protein PNOK_0815400 [Pyrrhoderma noxium]
MSYTSLECQVPFLPNPLHPKVSTIPSSPSLLIYWGRENSIFKRESHYNKRWSNVRNWVIYTYKFITPRNLPTNP